MRKGKILRQFKNFRIYKDLYRKLLKRDWVARVVSLIQILLIFGGRWNRYFWDIWLKIYMLPGADYLIVIVIGSWCYLILICSFSSCHYQKFESPIKFPQHQTLKMAAPGYKGLYRIKYKISNILHVGKSSLLPLILTKQSLCRCFHDVTFWVV